MIPVIFKAQLVSECRPDGDPGSSGGDRDGVFRMGWFSVSGKGYPANQKPPSPTDYQYIRSRLSYILCLQKSQDFVLFYRGPDGQRIVIDKDEELQKAITQLDDGLCKVYVCLKGPDMACG